VLVRRAVIARNPARANDGSSPDERTRRRGGSADASAFLGSNRVDGRRRGQFPSGASSGQSFPERDFRHALTGAQVPVVRYRRVDVRGFPGPIRPQPPSSARAATTIRISKRCVIDAHWASRLHRADGGRVPMEAMEPAEGLIAGSQHPKLRIVATDTPAHYRSLVLYEIFVRNHGAHGTLTDVESDLSRIRQMGVDVIWLMPIHPIGETHRKGALGSPYSISDYFEVNPEYGSKKDLARLVKRAHDLGLKVMFDMVFNHTAHNAVLRRKHPEWYQVRARGVMPDWTDVAPLDLAAPGLAEYLLEILQYWARFGADGFRCDVAAWFPLSFWRKARRVVRAVRPGIIWLGESPLIVSVAEFREAGFSVLSDGELYQAFDILYDQDHLSAWTTAVKGKLPVTRYLELIRLQDCIYPANFVKMRFVENHDRPRIMSLAGSRARAMAWTAFQAFNKGAFLIYAGQESMAKHRPSLFDRDPIQWDGYALAPFLTALAELKKDPAVAAGRFVLLKGEPAICAAWQWKERTLYGIFNVQSVRGRIGVDIPDGSFVDLLSGAEIKIRSGQTTIPPSACIFVFVGPLKTKSFYSYALDYLSHP